GAGGGPAGGGWGAPAAGGGGGRAGGGRASRRARHVGGRRGGRRRAGSGMPLPGDGEEDGEACGGGEGDRPLRGSRASATCFDSRRLWHVSIQPGALETWL